MEPISFLAGFAVAGITAFLMRGRGQSPPPTPRSFGPRSLDSARIKLNLEEILKELPQAIVVLDSSERIRFLNGAGVEILRPSLKETLGRTVQECFPYIELYEFISRVKTAESPLREEILVSLDEERRIAAYGVALADDAVLVVLDDRTRLHQLEQMRSEFVANVSHELRTPITSIKGFVETLLDGAIDKPEDARRFLTIIARQSERLTTIFEDLLSLARIEDEAEKGGIPTHQTRVHEMLGSAVEICATQALARSITITIECDDELRADLNRSLMEQAIVNLIDNAVKYSEQGSPVFVRGFVQGDNLVLEVEDQGGGIDREHLPRVFERFYRADRGRSRKVGGTGLGLAIVKHIAQAHGGYPTVESAPGKGSSFKILVPRAH
jgi:two-component system phosphate regulon sensor histidine kinase PhoR